LNGGDGKRGSHEKGRGRMCLRGRAAMGSATGAMEVLELDGGDRYVHEREEVHTREKKWIFRNLFFLLKK